MIRTLMAAAALSAAMAPAALAQGYVYTADGYQSSAGVPGVTVFVQPRDAYVIRLSTLGKDVPTVNREITQAAWTACRLAPRTGNALETRPTAMSTCANQAMHDARLQFARILDARRSGYLSVASY
jgi:hypothetical protein